jgi:ABC-2 type transport system ATP-binding protein
MDGYSTGMRQRVKLAQALVHDPNFIILDEPTNGFDPKGREEVLELIYDVSHRKDMHLLLSSHLLHDVERTCDYVLLLKDGALIKQGVIRELKTRSEKIVEVEIKGDSLRFSQAVEQKGWRMDGWDRNRARVQLPMETRLKEVFQAAREAEIQIRGLKPSEESLEDLFMKSIEE